MAESKDFQKANYPLPVYNFRVTVDGTSMSFSEVTGINLEYEAVTYKHGLSFWEGEEIKKCHYDKYIPVTLKKGTVKGINFLYDWIKEKAEGPRTLEVSLCDEQGQPVVTWRFAKTVAVKLDAASFDAKSNDVSIESLELRATGISVVYH